MEMDNIVYCKYCASMDSIVDIVNSIDMDSIAVWIELY